MFAWVVVSIRVPFRVLFTELAYYLGDHSNSESFPYGFTKKKYGIRVAEGRLTDNLGRAFQDRVILMAKIPRHSAWNHGLGFRV